MAELELVPGSRVTFIGTYNVREKGTVVKHKLKCYGRAITIHEDGHVDVQILSAKSYLDDSRIRFSHIESIKIADVTVLEPLDTIAKKEKNINKFEIKKETKTESKVQINAPVTKTQGSLPLVINPTKEPASHIFTEHNVAKVPSWSTGRYSFKHVLGWPFCESRFWEADKDIAVY